MLISKKIAFFRFEASASIGAGHAIRSGVLADALLEEGWVCKIVTSKQSVEFIEGLKKYERISPEDFYELRPEADLLVVDNYELDETYEKHFRGKINKILVIDDLANRKHECDILLDQTYGRNPDDYKPLVPIHCKILVGSDYVLLRKEFIEMRPKALEKRRNTKKVERILISMGGSDPKNYTLKALELLKEAGFKGAIDIVLGFHAPNMQIVEHSIADLPNAITIHTNANMPKLIYDADLAIGAAGSTVWERCCLGIPQLLVQTADNQERILQKFQQFQYTNAYQFKIECKNYGENLVDGFGINRTIKCLLSDDSIQLRKVTKLDKDLIYQWQKNRELRKYFNNSDSPLFHEHEQWFFSRVNQHENPFWIITKSNEDCGAVSLTYNFEKNYYELSWYVIPEKWGRGIGTEALKVSSFNVKPFKIHAYVKEKNIASHKSLKKAGFERIDPCNYIFGYRCT